MAKNIAGFPTLATFADRVHSDDDLAPLEAAALYPKNVEKVLHFAGKNRDIKDFEKFLDQTQQQGIQNLLLLTGDKLKLHENGIAKYERTLLFGVCKCDYTS